jgi:hypothetical protein
VDAPASGYLTKPFSEAATYPHREQMHFLAQLQESPFYRPGRNDSAFRDTAAFCLSVSKDEPADFARKLHIPRSLLDQWMESQHLPYPAPRLVYARRMIHIALENNDWDSDSAQIRDNDGYRKLTFGR